MPLAANFLVLQIWEIFGMTNSKLIWWFNAAGLRNVANRSPISHNNICRNELKYFLKSFCYSYAFKNGCLWEIFRMTNSKLIWWFNAGVSPTEVAFITIFDAMSSNIFWSCRVIFILAWMPWAANFLALQIWEIFGMTFSKLIWWFNTVGLWSVANHKWHLS